MFGFRLIPCVNCAFRLIVVLLGRDSVSGIFSMLFGRAVDDFPVDNDIASRNERVIQFYVVVCGLLFTSSDRFASSVWNIRFATLIVFSVLYYILITRTLGIDNEKKYKIVFLGYQIKTFKKLVNLCALFLAFGLVQSLLAAVSLIGSFLICFRFLFFGFVCFLCCRLSFFCHCVFDIFILGMGLS